MAAENPNWHIMQHQTNVHSNSPLFSLLHHQLSLHGDGGSPNNSSSSSSSSSTSSIPLLDVKSPHQQPWSEILMSGAEEESLELNTPNNQNILFGHDDDNHHHHERQFIKQEVYGHGGDGHGHDMDYHHEHIHHEMANMTHMVFPSPKPCVTTLSSNNNNINNFTDFSLNSCKDRRYAQHSFESNSYATAGGAPKKPRVQSSSIPPLKVRKEKLGDRITALHLLVSPFGKTDTASVLIETIGCIKFLQAQIKVLSSPYFGNPPSKNYHVNYVANYVTKDETLKELRSKGLCLVPITSLTHFVGMDNNSAAEYWAPSLADGF